MAWMVSQPFIEKCHYGRFMMERWFFDGGLEHFKAILRVSNFVHYVCTINTKIYMPKYRKLGPIFELTVADSELRTTTQL